MEHLDISGTDSDHLDLLKKVIAGIKGNYDLAINTEPTLLREITIFFTDAKISDKSYYFFPKNILQINQNNTFFIIDCFLDFGYFAGSRGVKDNGTSQQIWGYAKTKEDAVNLVIRPITRADKLIGNFISSGIKLNVSEEFDNKYYVASNQSNVSNHLNKEFIDLAAKCNNLFVYIKNGQLMIGFLEEKITSNQILYLCKLLNSMTFIEATM